MISHAINVMNVWLRCRYVCDPTMNMQNQLEPTRISLHRSSMCGAYPLSNNRDCLF